MSFQPWLFLLFLLLVIASLFFFLWQIRVDRKALGQVVYTTVQKQLREIHQRMQQRLVRAGRPRANGPIFHASPCGRLRACCDLVPSPLLRKRVTKLVADQEFHIDRMLREGRPKTARFNHIATWLLFFWYLFKGVVGAIAPFQQKRSE